MRAVAAPPPLQLHFFGFQKIGSLAPGGAAQPQEGRPGLLEQPPPVGWSFFLHSSAGSHVLVRALGVRHHLRAQQQQQQQESAHSGSTAAACARLQSVHAVLEGGTNRVQERRQEKAARLLHHRLEAGQAVVLVPQRALAAGAPREACGAKGEEGGSQGRGGVGSTPQAPTPPRQCRP